MSNREKAMMLLDKVPENKLYYIIGVLEGAAIPENMTEDDDFYTEAIYKELEKSEQQIKEGKVIEARAAVQGLREKYAL